MKEGDAKVCSSFARTPFAVRVSASRKKSSTNHNEYMRGKPLELVRSWLERCSGDHARDVDAGVTRRSGHRGRDSVSLGGGEEPLTPLSAASTGGRWQVALGGR